MMETLCDYSMYFPSVPISSVSDPTEYATLPRRDCVYLGESVHFLLVLRFRGAAGRDESSGAAAWRDLAASLSALASVCVAESRQQSGGSADGWEEQPGHRESGDAEKQDSSRSFRRCKLLLTHNSDGRQREREPAKPALLLDDQVIFCLTVSLDKLPADTLQAKVVATVWTQQEKAEVRDHGYLTLLQLRSPTHTFRQDLNTFKAQVSTVLSVLPPPGVQCQQMTVCGKHLTVLKVVNCSSKEEVLVRDVKILPNYNSSYLPMMPDGSILIVDNVCHQAAEVTMASFCRMNSRSSHLPSILSSLEEQNFLFQLQLQSTSEKDSSKGLEVPLVAVLQWCIAALPPTRCIASCYSLPSIRVDRPRLVMTASCPSAVRPFEHFWVKYTILNDLQDFQAVRLIWNSDAHAGGGQGPGVQAVVCQSPHNLLGQCRKGSTLCFAVAFQILRTGLFELSQHMKLKLQFTASMSTRSPLDSLSSSRPAVRGPPARSHSSSYLQLSRSQHFRSGSTMEPRTITPPVGSLMTEPTSLPGYNMLTSLDKTAKRECKVLVLEAIQEANTRLYNSFSELREAAVYSAVPFPDDLNWNER